MEQRKCYKCETEKPLNNDFFYKEYNGYQKICKDCQKKRNKEYREDNKEYFNKKNKEHYKKENNKTRYKKYQKEYLERRTNFSKTIRGKLYDLLEAARGRAKKNNLPIDIDLNFLLDMFEQQNRKCKLTNLDFTFEIRESGKHFNPFNPSIDKINPNGGYTKDNVRLICVIVNLALNQFGEDNFKVMCEAYINNLKNKGEVL